MNRPARIVIFALLALNTAVGQDRIDQLTGRYEGTAKTKKNEVFPVVLDVEIKGSVVSGRLAIPQAVYPLVSGTQDGNRATITFDADGNSGTISATLAQEKLVGSYKLGDESGSIELSRTKATPVLTGKSAFATPIMFLGVYHMDNPGLDEVNLKADDVLAPKRQQELESLVQRLARFKPTVVAIEAPYRDRTWPDRYQKYLVGQYTLGRNEIGQIGFRIARSLHLGAVYGIDYPMFMSGLRPDEMQQSAGKDSGEPTSPSPLSKEDEVLRHSTIVEYLARLNTSEEINKSPEYMGQLLPNDSPAIYAGADMVSNWYKRNLRIFSNIIRLAKPGQDRVLVIIGHGHLHLLKQFVSDAPYFEDVDVEEYLGP